MNKSELRKLYKSKRTEFCSEQINQKSILILENLKKLPIWDYSVFHVFVPIESQNEINTFPLIDFLFQNNKRVVVPMTFGNQMISCEIKQDVMWERGNFNVPEPKDYLEISKSLLEVVFVPMLICDSRGNRIGYGGGFYDRFFETIESNVVKIGINFFSPRNEVFATEPFDIPVDYCVTSKEIVSFIS